MAFTNVQDILAAGEDLIPWIEERALRFAMHRFVMASRVTVFNDMSGWETRKISNYLDNRGAQTLSEGVAIPTNQINRKRYTTIDPAEYGDRYPITDRRFNTDTENILADTVEFLGYSLGRTREINLLGVGSSFTGGSLGASGSAYTMDLPVQAQSHFEAQAFNGQLYHVIHPYQELDVLTHLIDLSKAAVTSFREDFIRQYTFGGFGGLNIVVSSLLPRNVSQRMVFTEVGGGGTFKLEVGDGNVTGDITFSATPATLATNIKTALDALSLGTWTVADGGGGLPDIDVTPPTTLFYNEGFELRKALDIDGNWDEALTGTVTLAFQERSAFCNAPFYERQAIALDIRQPVRVYMDWDDATRTLDIGAYETYGHKAWRVERGMNIVSDATAPTAIA